MANLKPILDIILSQYSLPWAGYHGVAHWARVLENGLMLSEKTGADANIVSLFAVLHDSKRINEGCDPEHGPRAADMAVSLRGDLIQLSDSDFELLFIACRDHTHEHCHGNVTVQTCWDADRLDLGRVGISIIPSRLCTSEAKSPEILAWCTQRATQHTVPEIVNKDWVIDLSSRSETI